MDTVAYELNPANTSKGVTVSSVRVDGTVWDVTKSLGKSGKYEPASENEQTILEGLCASGVLRRVSDKAPAKSTDTPTNTEQDGNE